MMLRNYASMTNLEYHEKQLNYNITNLLSEIKNAYPEDSNPDLNNPKYHDFLKNNAFNPEMIGGLADSFGLKGKVLSTELWKDLANGWCPVNEDTEPSLAKQAVDTPKGKMIQFGKSATTILPDGTYDLKKTGEKSRRCGTEFIFCFGERLSSVVGLMATQDPSIELEFKNMCMEVFNQEIMPEMLNLARIRKGADGVEYNNVAEIFAVPFLHSENRAEQNFYHFHFDLLNVARGYDGEIHSLTNDEISMNASMLDAKFMSSMKERFENHPKFGFVFEEIKHRDDLENDFIEFNDKKTVSFDIPEALIPKNVMEYRSVREKEMELALKKSGKKGPEAKELARFASRDDKTEKSPAELKAQWKKDYDQLGWSVEKFQADLAKYKKEQPKLNMREKPSDMVLEDSFIRNHKDIAFTESQYKAHIHKQLLGYMSSKDAQREATRIFEKDCHLSLSKDQMEYFKPLLEDTITDPIQRNTLQLRFLREAKFLHTSTIERDKYISESLKARDKETGFTFDRKDVDSFIIKYESKQKGYNGKPFKFGKEQREAIHMILNEPGAVSNVAGRAGAGKSTLLDCARAYLVEQGYQVLGTSTSSTATKGLAQSTGMAENDFHNTTKLVKLLDEGKLKITPKTILFWDEAGMADSKTFYEVIKHVNNGGGKLVLVGEKEQLQPISAGGLYKILNEQFTTTKVTEINRQIDSWQRDMVEDFASGRSHKAIRTLHEEGKVTITKTESQRLEQITDDYLKATEKVVTGDITIKYLDKDGKEKSITTDNLSYTDVFKQKNKETGEEIIHEKEKTVKYEELLKLATSDKKWAQKYILEAIKKETGEDVTKVVSVQDNLIREELAVGFKDKIIIAPTNDEIDMINEKIREKMKASGMLPTEEVTIKGKDGVEREFSKGDRIIVTKNQKTDDLASTKILNAEQGQVTDIQYSKITGQAKLIKLKMDDGKDVTLDLDKSHNIKHAYATSVHKSQGQTKTNAYYWVSNNMNSLHSAYVACSRHRKNLTMYLSEDMVSSMENKLDGKEPTAQMKKVAQWVAKEEKIALPPETLQSFTQTRAWLNEHWNKVAGESGSSLDRFTSVVEAMSATNYKKTSHDYQVLDGAMKNTYESIKVQRVEEIRNYKSQAVEPPDVLKAQIAQRQVQELAMKRQQQELHAQKIQAEILAKQQQNKPSGMRI